VVSVNRGSNSSIVVLPPIINAAGDYDDDLIVRSIYSAAKKLAD